MVKRKKDVSIEPKPITFTPKKGWLEAIAEDNTLHFNMNAESRIIVNRLSNLVSSYSVDMDNNKLEISLKKGKEFPQRVYGALAAFWKIEGLPEEYEFKRVGYDN